MKFQVSIKDPDILRDSIKDAIKDEGFPDGLSDEEKEILEEHRLDSVYESITKTWVEYGEYYVIEFDTDAGTATVIPRDKQ